MNDPPPDRPPDLRSYGRRRGRPRSPRQEALMREVLPQVAIDLSAPLPSTATALFKAPVDRVWLEIGFGGAEHLIAQAEANPTTGLIGCEPFEDGVVKALDQIAARALANVRLLSGDARPLIARLPAGSVVRAFILFPDPWPKARHRKRRLVSPDMLGALARIMPAGAELRLASDIADYVSEMLAAVAAEGNFRWTAESPQDWRDRPPDWPATRYEQKAIAAGRRCTYLRLERR